MGMILSIHSTKAFQEFLLPAINNSENSIILDKDIFSLDKDIELCMEVIEYCWHFLSSKYYRIEETVNHKEYAGITLQSGDLLTVILPDGERISVMVDETGNFFKVFEKYDIKGIGDITVGRNDKNDIVYNTRNLISG